MKITGKRAAFISIQLKHHVPSEHSETMRVRTGYEAVLAHRTGEVFACTARHDGVVEEIDSELGLIRVRYTHPHPPQLKLESVSSSSTIRTKFSEAAERELGEHRPVFIAQADDQTSAFHLHDVFLFKGVRVRVVDIIPLTDLAEMPMNDYLSDSAKEVLRHAKHPVIVKLIPVVQDAADEVDIFKFGTKFTSVSGSFVKQSVVCNVVAGQRIHQGDVLAFNSGFFEQDPFDLNQVTWKHGVMANIVLMECNNTIEDSNAITPEFSRLLETSNSHLRTLKLTSNTIIRDIRPIGSDVQTTDLLCTLEDADIADLSSADDSAMLELLTSLNRKAPRAHYHGTIADIDILYACPISDMHPSLAALADQINMRKAALAQAAEGTHKTADYPAPAQVKIGTKYHGIEFNADTVLVMFYITESIDHGTGDKLVIGNQAKSVTAEVLEKPMETETGYPVDMLFSARSINNRIITSPTTVGFTNRVLEKLEEAALATYFDA